MNLYRSLFLVPLLLASLIGQTQSFSCRMPLEFYPEAGTITLQNFFLMVNERVNEGKLIVYRDTGLKDTMRIDEFNQLQTHITTDTITDESKPFMAIVTNHSIFDPYSWHSIDKKTNRTDILFYQSVRPFLPDTLLFAGNLPESISIHFRTTELTDTVPFKGNLMPWLLNQSDQGVWDKQRMADEFNQQFEIFWQSTYERIKQGQIPVYSHLTMVPYANWEELWEWLQTSNSTTMCPDSFRKENINGTCFLLDPSLDQNGDHVLSWDYIGSTFSPCIGGILLPEQPMFYIKREDFLKHCDEKTLRILEASLEALIFDRMSRVFRIDEDY